MEINKIVFGKKLFFEVWNPMKLYEYNSDMFAKIFLVVDGKVVGHFYLTFRGKRAWLWTLEIRTKYRGLGFGTTMLDKAVEICKNNGYTNLVLECDKTNVVGNKLYRSFGFHIVDPHPNYYYTYYLNI